MSVKLTYCIPIAKFLIGMSLSLLITLTPNDVHADPMQDSQKRFSAYRERVFQLQSNENAKYIIGELNTLNQWISEAERYLRDEDEDEFIQTVRLVQAQLRLVDVSLEELNAREQILRLNEEANRLETKAKNEREAVVELEKLMGGSLHSAPRPAPPVQPPPAIQPPPPVQPAPPVRFGGQP